MKMNKKIMIVGISLMLVSVVIAGCMTQSEIKKQTLEMKPPTFNLKDFSFTVNWWQINSTEASMVFNENIENPNDEPIQLQMLFCYVMDENGNTLLSFTPGPIYNVNLYLNTLNTSIFTLGAHENITLWCTRSIYKNTTIHEVWNYLGSSNNVSISGLFKLNGEIQWFQSNSCNIGQMIHIDT